MTTYRLKDPKRADEVGKVLVVVDGVRYYLDPAQDYDDDHPAVAERPDLFRAPNVEAATAGPGERRSTKRTTKK